MDAIKGELEALAPTGLQRNVRSLRRRGAGAATPSLEAVSNALQAAAMAMQAAEVGADGGADRGGRRGAGAGEAGHGAVGGGEGEGGRACRRLRPACPSA